MAGVRQALEAAGLNPKNYAAGHSFPYRSGYNSSTMWHPRCLGSRFLGDGRAQRTAAVQGLPKTSRSNLLLSSCNKQHLCSVPFMSLLLWL